MITEPVPFPVFRADVLALYQKPLRRVSTFRKMRQVLDEFGALCTTTGDLSPATVARWISDHPGRRSSTIRTLLSTLRAAARYGEARGYFQSPFRFRGLASWVPRNDEEPIPRGMSLTDVAKVLTRADLDAQGGDWKARRDQLLVNLAASTGARASELLGARTEDVDLIEGTLHIRANPRRGLKTISSRRKIHLTKAALHIVSRWITRQDHTSPWLIPHTELDGPWLGGAPGHKPYQRVKALAARAGVPDVTLLSFRHAFASAADHWQIGPKTLQDILGHSSPATQWTYRHTDPAELRRAAERVHFPTHSPPPLGPGTPPPPSPGA